jgi:hypothetical protein
MVQFYLHRRSSRRTHPVLHFTASILLFTNIQIRHERNRFFIYLSCFGRFISLYYSQPSTRAFPAANRSKHKIDAIERILGPSLL